MARIPEAELERLKREISVERLAESRGVKLKRHGKDLLGLCPFHDDKEPSLVISPKTNLWHCLGACQAGGSAVDWVMRDRDVSFRHAVELLRADVPEPSSTVAAPERGRPSLPPPVEANAEDAELLRRVVGFYHEALKESPEALKYLASRGLDHPEAVDHFQLGYANRTLGYRLPRSDVKAGREIRGRLQGVGILRQSGHEHFNGSLVIPVLDARGEVVEIYGRKVQQSLRKGTPLHLYLPGPHAGVFNGDALRASKEIILCESLVDALTFWCAGFRNVTAAYGVGGFTAEMLEAFVAHNIERVLIAFDRDKAGDEGAAKVAEQLLAAGIEAYRVQFPRRMDANEYAQSVQPAAKSLDLLLRRAEWMGVGEAPAERVPLAAVEAVVEVSPAAEPDEEAAKGEEQRALPLAASATPQAAEVADVEDEPPTSSALPAPPAPSLPVVVSDHEVTVTFGDRQYRVRGLAKNLSYDVLKINLLATRGEGFHVDTLDLYSARQRNAFVKQSALELAIEPRIAKRDVGRVLLALEKLQDEQIKQTLEPEKDARPTMTPAERAEAEALLEAPDLLDRITEDFRRCGMVGEASNTLLGYLAAVSRKLSRPLAVVVQSSSAAGKSALMDAVLALMPEEERVQYSAMTGQSLFYMGETELKHKILAIAEEEGAERASYALKLLQSEGELTIASTGKDPASGKLVTHEYRVEGPVMIFLTTTAIDVDEELLNRCLVLSVDEARAQTRAIHAAQRERRTLAGLVAGVERATVVALHQNAQRLLQPLAVVNPYAPRLTFGDTMTRTRRDHEKYLTLIDTIALLHQRQRDLKTAAIAGAAGEQEVEYIEVAIADIAAANDLAHEVLGRTLDELPPQTRRLLALIERFVIEGCEREGLDHVDYRFSRRALREATGQADTQLRLHLSRLVDLEYLFVHQGSRGRSYLYELVHAPSADDQRGLPGLIDVASLGYDEKNAGIGNDLAGARDIPRGKVADFSGHPQPAVSTDVSDPLRGVRGVRGGHSKGPKNNAPSYVDPSRTLAAGDVSISDA